MKNVFVDKNPTALLKIQNENADVFREIFLLISSGQFFLLVGLKNSRVTPCDCIGVLIVNVEYIEHVPLDYTLLHKGYNYIVSSINYRLFPGKNVSVSSAFKLAALQKSINWTGQSQEK